MRTLIYVMTALAVIGLAFWAYHENYKTQAALSESQRLSREIGQAQDQAAEPRA